MEELFIPTLSHFENGNGWTGSHQGVEFQIETPNKEGKTVNVVVWYAPYSREYAKEQGCATFPVSEEGRETLTTWLKGVITQLNETPTMTKEECRAYYLKVKGGD